VRFNREATRWSERDPEARFLLDGTLDHLESARVNLDQAIKDARTLTKWETGPWKRIVAGYRVGNNAVDAVMHGVTFGKQLIRGEAPNRRAVGGSVGVRIPAQAVDDYVSDLKARMRAAGGAFPDSELGGLDGQLVRGLELSRYGRRDDGSPLEIRPHELEPMLDFLAEELKAAGGDQRFIAGIYWLAANGASPFRYGDVLHGPTAERFAECVKRTIGLPPPKRRAGAIDPVQIDAYVAHVIGKIDRFGSRGAGLAPEDVALLDALARDRPPNAERDVTSTLLEHAAYRLKLAAGDERSFLFDLSASSSRASYATGPHLSHDAAKLFVERVKQHAAAPPSNVWEHPSGYEGP
jgi:hypothetical protein